MIRCAPWISSGAGDEALVLFDENDDSYHALNKSASAIWRLLADGLRPPEVAAALVATYGIDPEAAEQGVAAFVAAALARGLLIDEGRSSPS